MKLEFLAQGFSSDLRPGEELQAFRGLSLGPGRLPNSQPGYTARIGGRLELWRSWMLAVGFAVSHEPEITNSVPTSCKYRW